GIDTRRERRGPDRAGRAVEHRTVRGRAAAEVMPAHDAREAFALGGTDDVDVVLLLEGVAENLVAGLELVALVRPDFHQRAHRRDTGLLEAAAGGLVRRGVRTRSDQADLDGLVAVLVGGLLLHDEARARLHDRAGNDRPVFLEDLGHPDLLADDSVYGHGSTF